ncbi:dephospho-CoA kinase [Acidihalobacter aeolianus]|uniref:Dephospho-CoA kinase n=1 Tax=Acidihalobacter aeolianus TaxID=2792603 RepID=A0A1D8KAA0_9GAMM|nr:dephospho-CoA kinase [Acidihalobacter aeolianus]AOV17899.1 dephospho-CoA kinase [Acidihalobacter aeolianus]
MTFRVGLTGGIGCGKSTVSELFAARGIPVIDSDLVARELVRPGEPALAEIAAAFGPEVLHDDGTLDRRALRSRVFKDEEMRRRLEGILHPHIKSVLVTRSASANAPYTILVVPLLLESGWENLVDRILVVDCAPETQIRRVIARDGCNDADVRDVMQAQCTREARLGRADDVIRNEDSDRHLLDARVAELDVRYREAARV